MTHVMHALAARSRGRSALRSFAWLLLPTALFVNACSDSDSSFEETDAGDSGRRDAASDAARRDGATDSGVDALRSDASEAGRDVQADAPRSDASLDAPTVDAGAEARADGAPDGRVDAGLDAAPDSGADASSEAATLIDAGTRETAAPGDAAEAAAPEAAPPADAAAPEAAPPPEAAAPEAAAAEAAAPETTADAAPPVESSTADADGGVSPAPDGSADASATLQYGFENGVSGWTAGPYYSGAPADPTIAPLTTSTVQRDTGASSLAVTFTRRFTDGTFLWIDAPPGLVPGKVVTVRMFIPANTVVWFDIFDTDATPSGQHSDTYFHGDEPSPRTLLTDGWYTYTHVIATTAVVNDGGARVGPIQRLGFKLGVWTPGTIYIDSITW